MNPSYLPTRRHYRSEMTDTARWDHFQPRDADVLVCAMEKHGTTWTQTLVAMLLNGGPALSAPLRHLSPWFDGPDLTAEEAVAGLDTQAGRRVVKTHTPADGIPYFPQCTYIVVCRDPRDAFFSRAEHADNMREAARWGVRRVANFDAEFREWVNAPWISGLQTFCLEETLYHLHSFASLGLPNVHLLHYTDLRRDPAAGLDRAEAALGPALARWMTDGGALPPWTRI